MYILNLLQRIARHTRITSKNYFRGSTPPFLILFINSICNMKCEHCFYWQSLNSKDDLTNEEIFELSRSMGRIESLNLSGGEPFLRREFSEICRQFIQHNKVRQIYVPTNGWYTDKTITQIKDVLNETELEIFAVEISLDGMPEFHDKFRVAPGAFERAMQTYDALAELQKSDERLRIHAISTATAINLDEIKQLTTYLYERCPKMDHHNLALIRGDRKNPSLTGPKLQEYQDLYKYLRRLWQPRESGRYGASVEPMLQWAKAQTAIREEQVIPCRAGTLSAVVYANGDVSVCEIHNPLGNLRDKSFVEIWNSSRAKNLRNSIANKECYCTNEVFLWPSIVFQPPKLIQVMTASKAWEKVKPLPAEERVELHAANKAMSNETAQDGIIQVQIPNNKTNFRNQ
ncbi:MAG: radical SAM protein [Chloroflexi bacterium]|nr:radical SAM protein [Chloroflexota bacterium]